MEYVVGRVREGTASRGCSLCQELGDGVWEARRGGRLGLQEP